MYNHNYTKYLNISYLTASPPRTEETPPPPPLLSSASLQDIMATAASHRRTKGI